MGADMRIKYTMVFLLLILGSAIVGYYLLHKEALEPTEKLIERLYEGVTNKISQRERDMMEQVCGQKSPVYGEILYSSWKAILDDIKPTDRDVLYDLGCGVGKVAIQALFDTPIKQVIGVELSPTRAARAQYIKKKLEQEHKIPPEKALNIYKQNMLDANLDDATIVYMCSTCYPDELMRDITTKLEAIPAKNKVRIITLKPLSDTSVFSITKKYHLPMTWSKESGSPVYLYERK